MISTDGVARQEVPTSPLKDILKRIRMLFRLPCSNLNFSTQTSMKQLQVTFAHLQLPKDKEEMLETMKLRADSRKLLTMSNNLVTLKVNVSANRKQIRMLGMIMITTTMLIAIATVSVARTS